MPGERNHGNQLSTLLRKLDNYPHKNRDAQLIREQWAQQPSCTNEEIVAQKLQSLFLYQRNYRQHDFEEKARQVVQIEDINERIVNGDLHVVEELGRIFYEGNNRQRISQNALKKALQFCHFHAPERFPEWDEVTDIFLKAYKEHHHCNLHFQLGQIGDTARLICDFFAEMKQELNMANDAYDNVKDKMYDVLLSAGIFLTDDANAQRLLRTNAAGTAVLVNEVLNQVFGEAVLPMPIIRLCIRILVAIFSSRIEIITREIHTNLLNLRDQLRAHAPPTI